MSYLETNLPSIDLHGENKDTARILTEEFLNDNYKLGKNRIIIVHGIGKGILKKEVHSVLKKNKFVLDYKLDNFNIGCTIVNLKPKIDNGNKKCYNTRNMGGGY